MTMTDFDAKQGKPVSPTWERRELTHTHTISGYKHTVPAKRANLSGFALYQERLAAAVGCEVAIFTNVRLSHHEGRKLLKQWAAVACIACIACICTSRLFYELGPCKYYDLCTVLKSVQGFDHKHPQMWHVQRAVGRKCPIVSLN